MGTTLFHILATFICFLLGIIWNSKNWPNLMLKFVLYITGIWGLLVCLHDFGYIIKL